ncbi:MAG: glycosyltransferase family 39 protein [Chloroflexi bacterium]|nr:glycosyltransferase family 39 protein [Chloroflexota bacterium]
MASLGWLEASLPGLLPALWMSLGLGLPWSLALLGREQWQSRTLIAALALALGPACMTAWMLALGTVGGGLGQGLITAELIMLGSAVIAATGASLAWRKRKAEFTPVARSPLAIDEKLIICLVAVAIALRWLHTAYFPFTAYDALWVYGYQGRLYFLEGFIPNDIAYYPQFLPLQFAYVQTLLGEINDHAARMVLPLLHIGSLLAAYQLGARLVGRRTGLYCAALWFLHPHVGQWAFVGDLEIPLALSFTLAATFFLCAWRADCRLAARRDALLAGLLLGIALFTKPTAGAFVWGVLLCLAVEILRTRLDASRWRSRFLVAVYTGLACLPLGGIWYARNWLLGHELITFPKAVWLARALRSGDYLAPLAASVVVVFLTVALLHKLPGRRLALGWAGLALLLAGLLASNATLFPGRVDPPASNILPLEALVMAVGLTLAAGSLYGYSGHIQNEATRRAASAAGWGLLLAAPYFVTYFFSYSYHYRLGFATLPLLCLPTAAALSKLVQPERMRSAWRRFCLLALVLLCLPGVISVAFDVRWSSVWLLRADLTGDWQKLQVFNPSLMEVVAGLHDFLREDEREPIVVAPGEERLPFFFPQMQIIDQPVTRLDELEALGATHFIFGAKARGAYRDAGIDPLTTQLVAALGRHHHFRLVKAHDDGFFSYELYQVHKLDRRRDLPASLESPDRVVQFGESLQLYAEGAFPQRIFTDTPITLEPNWRALLPLKRDYRFVAQLFDPVREIVAQEWFFEAAPHRHGAYSTRHWELDEIVRDYQILRLHDDADFSTRYDMIMRLGVWDAEKDAYLPLTIDGAPADEFYQLPGTHRVRL